MLDGARAKGDDGLYGFVPDPNSACFVAVLSSAGTESIVRIFYRACAASKVAVGGSEFLLDQGSGALEIGARQCARQGYVYVELKLLAPISNRDLFIKRVSVVSES